MHELSIALSLLDVAEEEAQRQGGGQVHAIHLRLGPLAGVVKEALVGAFELAREGTSLEQTRLKIEDIPVRGHCPQCEAEVAIVSIQERCCPVCESVIVQLVSGQEMEVFALEMDS